MKETLTSKLRESYNRTTLRGAKRKGWKALPAIAVAVAMCLTACEQRQVDRTVELHYINGEVETRTLRGYTNRQPVIYTNYGTPNYNDGNNRIYGVVRFQVLRVDTLAEKGGRR